MDVVRFAIQNPVKITVGVILACLFGILSVTRIPVQLTPNVDEPRITVTTMWEGASAQEIEREIVDRQEELLKSVSNLREMTSQSVEGMATVELQFHVGTNKDDALRDTSDQLRQVTGYPIEAEQPTVVAADAALESPIAWMIFRSPGQDPALLRDFVDDNVKPILERADGIAGVDIYGGREREVQVRVDAAKLAARGLTFQDLHTALQRENHNISAGTITQGKRDFTYRTVGQYEQIDQVENTVIGYQRTHAGRMDDVSGGTGVPVYVRDVATVVSTHKKAYGFVRSLGEPVLALPARRESGANVISAMDALKVQIKKVNDEVLSARGMSLSLTQVYDETTYIYSAIRLVRMNLLFGGGLTVLVLLVFLRSITATGIVAVSIPISVVATFLAVALLGRPLNVIMLAGLAFSVGMVVDNAIVVLENIFRHRQMGKERMTAAFDGAREVWGAVLASTLTTMAVFLPVVFVEQEAGQLFRDIAIAISAAVFLSLIVSVLVIPTMAARFLRVSKVKWLRPSSASNGEHGVDYTSGRFANAVGRLVHTINGTVIARLGTVAGLTMLSVGLSVWLLPPTDYLPSGNRNLVFGAILTPPGLSQDEFRRMGAIIERSIRPAWEAKVGSPQAAALPPVQMPKGLGPEAGSVTYTPPPIENFFYVSWNGGCFMGATSKVEAVVKPLRYVLANAASQIPDTFAFFAQASLFGRRGGAGNNVELQVRGDRLDEVTAAASQLQIACLEKFGFPQSDPANYDRGRIELRVRPDRVKAAEAGLSVRDLGFIMEACVDGAYVGGFRQDGDEVDMAILVEGTDGVTKEELASVPIHTPSGAIVPLASVLNVEFTTAPQQINHIEDMPAVKLTITPPEGVALGTVIDTLENQVIAPLRKQGRIPPSVITALAGNADKLIQTRTALFGDLRQPMTVLTSRGFIALLVTYLLMAALFESFAYPLVIMFSVPLATVGGLMGLAIVHELSLLDPVAPVQQLDTLTMLGFVILVGVVVNNAILLVHQALHNLREYGMAPRQAISESVRTRVRPIFMTAVTSVCGMLPLVIAPGAGSELYRGLGAVMVGGLIVASVFTLVLVPALLSLFISARDALFSLFRPATAAVAPAAPARPPVARPLPAERPAPAGAGHAVVERSPERE